MGGKWHCLPTACPGTKSCHTSSITAFFYIAKKNPNPNPKKEKKNKKNRTRESCLAWVDSGVGPRLWRAHERPTEWQKPYPGGIRVPAQHASSRRPLKAASRRRPQTLVFLSPAQRRPSPPPPNPRLRSRVHRSAPSTPGSICYSSSALQVVASSKISHAYFRLSRLFSCCASPIW